MESSTKLNTFQKKLHKEIPLTKQMELEVSDFNHNSIVITAPLSNNINDKGSVFGGSSSALMIISAWSLIKLNCNDHNIEADIVIHKNETHWCRAMFSDLIIEAHFEKKYDFNKIKKKIAYKKHQRISCKISLQDSKNVIYSTMTAKYVIIAKKQ